VPQGKKAALAYHLQILDSVPADDNDQKVGILVTERDIVFSRRNLGGK